MRGDDALAGEDPGGVADVGALVAGPIAGIAAFVAQKLLKDPINQMAAYEYSVTGTWSDPQMAKLDSSQSAELDKSDKAGKK